MTDTITIPAGGVYVENSGMKWHIRIDHGDFSVRLVDGPLRYLGNLTVTMPAGNQVTVIAGLIS